MKNKQIFRKTIACIIVLAIVCGSIYVSPNWLINAYAVETNGTIVNIECEENVDYTGSNINPIVLTGVGTLVEGVDYEIEFTDSNGNKVNANINPGIVQYKVTLLADAFTFADGTKEATGIFTINPVIPKAVDTLTVIGRTQSSIKLSWSEVEGATGYRVYKEENGKLKLVDKENTTRSYNFTGLKSGIDYNFAVVAYVRVGMNDTISDEFKTIEARTLPGQITKIDVVERKATSIKIEWPAVAGAHGYRVYKKINGSYSWYKDVKNTNYTYTGLEANTSYKLGVKAYILDGNKIVLSNEMKEITADTAPGKTSKISVVARTQNNIGLKWNKVVGATGYRVYKLVNGKYAVVKSATTATSYTATGLSAGKAYKFAVKAYKKSGDSVIWSNVFTTLTTRTCPGKTSAITVTARSKSAVALKWNKVAGATGYRVYQYKNGKYVKVADTASVSRKITGLSSKKTYKFAVKAYTKYNGQVIWSNKYSTKSVKTK